jgi:hypothetical protein
MARERLAGITEPVGAAFFTDLNVLRAAANHSVCAAADGDRPALRR